MKSIVLKLFVGCCVFLFSAQAQAQYRVYTEDVTHFWEAYDSLQTTQDKEVQIDILQKLYVDRGTQGLREFMQLRGGTPERWQMFIEQDPERFEKIRPYTLSVLEQKKMIYWLYQEI